MSQLEQLNSRQIFGLFFLCMIILFMMHNTGGNGGRSKGGGQQYSNGGGEDEAGAEIQTKAPPPLNNDANKKEKKAKKAPKAAALAVPLPPPVQTEEPPLEKNPLDRPARVQDPLDFEFPPLPGPMSELPKSFSSSPSSWTGAEWGPQRPVNWTKAPAIGKNGPLFRRELKFIQDKDIFPKHPVSSLKATHEVLYAKNLNQFRKSRDPASASILEVGAHPKSASRPTYRNFFKQYLPKIKYQLMTEEKDVLGGDEKISRSAGSVSSLKALCQDLRAVDIMVGRAAEGIEIQLESFRYLFVNLLKPGGVYFIEDLDMNFLTNSEEVKDLAKDRHLMTDYIGDAVFQQITHDWEVGAYPIHGQYRADYFVNNWVQDVSCARGGCVITKKLVPFNRYRNMVYAMPRYNPDAEIRLISPPPLTDLGRNDKSRGPDFECVYGPTSIPVGGSLLPGDGGLPVWAIEANKFKLMSDHAASDKCQAISMGHQYHGYYAKLFAPWREALPMSYFKHLQGDGMDSYGWLSTAFPQHFTMMEIGIGCDVALTVPGGGYRLYRQFLPNVEYNAFEFQFDMCDRRLSAKPDQKEVIGYLRNHVFRGDQGKFDDLKNSIRKFGPLDVFVDDGSHLQGHQISTFRQMFVGGVKPDGLFVMEDMQTGWMGGHQGTAENQISRDIFVEVVRDLIVSLNNPSWLPEYGKIAGGPDRWRAEESISNWLEDFSCGREMCGFQKLKTPLSKW